MAQETTPRRFLAKREDGTSVWLQVRKPSRQELEFADLELSATFNRSLLAGLPTRQRLLRGLRESGGWKQADEDKFSNLRTEGVALEKRLEKDDFASVEEKQAAVERHSAILSEIQQMRAEMDHMLGHTADSKAENAHRECLVACTVEHAKFDSDGNPVEHPKAGQRFWPSVDDLKAETDTIVSERIFYEYMTFSSGSPSRWDELVDKKQATTTEEPAESEAQAAEANTEPSVAPADTESTASPSPD